jgi:stage II sporulation protein D
VRIRFRDSTTEWVVPAARFREALGTTFLKSTQFVAIAEPGGFRFEGKGYGHGVGMCQYGAKRLAEQGADAASILARYYPDARIQQQW